MVNTKVKNTMPLDVYNKLLAVLSTSHTIPFMCLWPFSGSLWPSSAMCCLLQAGCCLFQASKGLL